MRGSSSNNNRSRRTSMNESSGGNTTTTSRRGRSSSRRGRDSVSSPSPARIAPPPPVQTTTSNDFTCGILPAERFLSMNIAGESVEVSVPPTAPSQHSPRSFYQFQAAATASSSNNNNKSNNMSLSGSQTSRAAPTRASTATSIAARRSRTALPNPAPPMAVATVIRPHTTTASSAAASAAQSKKKSSSESNNKNNNSTRPTNNTSKKNVTVETEWSVADLDRRYDLTPVDQQHQQPRRGGRAGGGAAASGGALQHHHQQQQAQPSYFIDPWEVSVADESIDVGSVAAVLTVDADPMLAAGAAAATATDPDADDPTTEDGTDEQEQESKAPNSSSRNTTFLAPGDIHPNMEHKEEEIAHLRLLAGKLSADWRGSEFMAPALARRIRDFQFAQEKRRRKYGDERPWGILGLYDHLSAIRTDVDWAEDQSWRRANGEPYQSWADFDEAKRGGYNRPFFTYILLIVCTLIMIASIAVNGWKVEPLDENPMIGPSAETLIVMGAKDTRLIVEENEGWRLLSSAVLHAGLVHYFINMLALWFVGAAIETTHGWFAAMVIFIISAVGGTILSAIFLPEYITVGASGGIFGFIGACCADIVINWRLLFCDFVTENGKKHRHILVVVVLLFDIALNCLIGLTPYVDNFTHLGGMAYGFLCGLSTIERLSSDFFGMEEGWFTQVKHFVVRFFGLILSIVSLVITLVILLGMDATTNPCPGCTWLSCVPFPPWAGDTEKWWYCDDCGRITAEIVSRPYRHLELDCPGGTIAEVNFTSLSSQNMDRATLQKQLPSYCREYCPTQEERN